MALTRRDFGTAGLALALAAFGAPRVLSAQAQDLGARLARAAAGQQGVVTIYDPSYVTLDFPGGDVAADRGVCTDVLVRALRQAAGIDLQKAINVDMKANFKAYPALWGLKSTDRNIDHRRVPNLRRLFERLGAELPASQTPADYLPGDVVTCTLPGNLAHLMLVAQTTQDSRPMIVHNIGRGTQIEDRLFEFPLNGHYRLQGKALAKLKALAA